MFPSILHLAVAEAERRRDLERQHLVRAALQGRQRTPARPRSLRAITGAVLTTDPRRWFGRTTAEPSREIDLGTNVPACC
jgi:hypothetical protein